MEFIKKVSDFAKWVWEENQAGYARMAQEKGNDAENLENVEPLETEDVDNEAQLDAEGLKSIEPLEIMEPIQPEEPEENSAVNLTPFPHSMDSMMNLGIDILLKQPTMLILSWGFDEQEKIINRILDSCHKTFEKTSTCILVNAVTDTFFMHRDHPCNPFSAYGMEDAKAWIKWANKTTDERTTHAAFHSKKEYIGEPIYLLIDNFSIIRQKPQSPIASQLAHIMLCSRQSNIHTIVFERPDTFKPSESSWFSSFVMLSNSYREKYKNIFPPGYRNVKEGTFCILPYSWKAGIYEI